MNILLVNGNYNGGGAAQIARQLYHGLMKEKDVNAFMVVGKHSKNINNYEVFCSSLYETIIHRVSNELHGGVCYSNYHARKKLLKIIEDKKIDIVHFHNIANGYFGIYDIAAISKKCHVVWTLHEMWSITGGCTYVHECDGWLETECSNCDLSLGRIRRNNGRITHKAYVAKEISFINKGIFFVTPSVWLEEQCRKTYLKDERIFTIYNGIRVYKREIGKLAARKRYNISEDESVLLFVAYDIWNENKGLKDLIKALENCTSKIRLMVVGNGQKPKINNKRISVLKVDTVYKKEDMALLYKAADVFVLPSSSDNLPTVCLESIAYGTPVIAFDTGGVAEIIDGDTGWIIEEHNRDKLDRIIELALQNEDVLQEKSNNCKQVYEERFTLNKMVKSYLTLYKGILGLEE